MVNDQVYHIVTRGIDGRNIFNDESDYHRAIHNLFEFNDENPAGQRAENGSRSRKILVDILAFCLMPNHIHLLIKQVQDEGITKFMRKFGAGYVGYFNKKNERQGHLFQGRFRAVMIKSDAQLKAAFVYIHTNPASFVDPRWKAFQAENSSLEISEKIIEMIENYKWSSYPDYLIKDNFPSITQRDFSNSMLAVSEWRKVVNDWIFFKKGIEAWEGIDLD